MIEQFIQDIWHFMQTTAVKRQLPY